MCFRRPEPAVEGGEERGPLPGDHDVAGAPIGRIGPAFDQAGRFEVVEEVGHDGAVDAQVLGQGELASDDTPSGGGQDLVATWAAGEVGDRGVRGRHVGPKDRAETPTEVICQRVVTSAWFVGSLSLTRDVGHFLSIRALEPGTDAKEIFCSFDDLLYI
jgi:hypothetical protein